MTSVDTGKNPTLTYIDLFAGAGGLSEGFLQEGYFPIAHVEMDQHACESLKTRAAYYHLKEKNKLDIYYSYLKGELSREEFLDHIPQIILETIIQNEMSDQTIEGVNENISELLQKTAKKRVDIIVGGPPCQAYSLVGRSRKCMKDDPRNKLYRLYMKVLSKFQPKVFVFENVPGILNAGGGQYMKDIIHQFNEHGYELDYKQLNASDYGVLQNRQRIFIIGWQAGMDFSYPDLPTISHKFKVSDLLTDLPNIEPGEEATDYKFGGINEYLEVSGLRKPDDILTWHIARQNNDRDREIYRLAIKAWNEEGKRLNYSELPERLITHKNVKGFLDRFKVVAGNLKASHTMMAHISKDGHYYIHPDIEQARSISVREAARIQSFPDNYFFEGPRTSVFTQIGNAVPPLMSRAIAHGIKRRLH